MGLGPLPRAPLLEYLTRSISLLYGFHGVLMFILATDVQRYRPLIRFAAIMGVVFGLAMMAIDATAPMPLPWTLLEGPPIALTGVVTLALLRRLDRAESRR